MAEPIEAKYLAQMNLLASELDDRFNGKGVRGKSRKVGFVLLVFPFGEGKGNRTNYISNADRRDIVVLLKEMTARFEGQPEISGRA